MSSEQSHSPSASPSVSVRFLVKSKTAAAEAYRYLLHNPNWSAKDGQTMLSQSAQNYWLAYARQSADPDLAKTTALACVERLEFQIVKLRRDFQLASSPALSPLSQTDPGATLLDLLAEVKRGSQALEAISTMLIKSNGVVLPTSPAPTNNGITSSLAGIPNLPAELEVVEPEPEGRCIDKEWDEFYQENNSMLESLSENWDFA